MKRPTVTILIPVYNAGSYLREAVQSVVDSPGTKQIIVIDDGSTDGTVDSIRDLPVEIIRKRRNSGTASALNAGLKHMRGRYVTLLDQDDRLAKGGLSWRVKYLNRHPECLAVGGRPAGVIDAAGRPIKKFKHLLHPKFSPPKNVNRKFYAEGGLYPVELWNYLFRRELIEKVGKFNTRFRIAFDFEYFMRILKLTDIPIVFKPTVYWRLHGYNLSKRGASLSCELKPQTIRECREIFRKNGMRMGNTKPWLLSYGLR